MKKILMFLAVIAVMAVPSFADTMYAYVSEDTGCDACAGLVFSLNVEEDGSLNGYNFDYTVTYHVEGDYDGDSRVTNISAVNFKVSSDLESAWLISAPGVMDGWSSPLFTPINDGGSATCSGGDAGFGCVNVVTTDPAVTQADLGSPTNLTWIFGINLPDGVDLFADLEGSHIGAKFNNDGLDLKGHILSCEAQVPEPSIILLLGMGLGGLGLLARRKKI